MSISQIRLSLPSTLQGSSTFLAPGTFFMEDSSSSDWGDEVGGFTVLHSMAIYIKLTLRSSGISQIPRGWGRLQWDGNFYIYAFIHQICIKYCCVVLGAVLALGMQGKKKTNEISALLELTAWRRKTSSYASGVEGVTKMLHMCGQGGGSQGGRRQLSVETELMRATGPGVMAVSGSRIQAWSVPEQPLHTCLESHAAMSNYL